MKTLYHQKIQKAGIPKTYSDSLILFAIRFNKYCRELYERLVSKCKAKKLALVAVAHNLLRQTWLLKNKRPFDENFCT